MSSPRPSAFIVEGIRTALAASARFAKTPSLLGDMVYAGKETGSVKAEDV
jgi:hypothetical protein